MSKMTVAEAAAAIREEARASLFEPGSSWPNWAITERAAQRVAAHQLCLYILQHPKQSPLVSIDLWAEMMDEFSTDYPPEVGIRFSIARDWALGLLSLRIVY